MNELNDIKNFDQDIPHKINALIDKYLEKNEISHASSLKLENIDAVLSSINKDSYHQSSIEYEN